MSLFLVKYTINDDGREFGQHFIHGAKNLELAKAEVEEIARLENIGDLYTADSDDKVTNLLHDYTTQTIDIDSVVELTATQVIALNELGIAYKASE
jgi:hypothetical protein